MRISKGYWLWGLFPSTEKVLLNEIKAKVQSKLKSPFFETHITLAGPYLNIDNNFSSLLTIFLIVKRIRITDAATVTTKK